MELNLRIPSFIESALYDPAKYVVIVSGRRTGKTFNAVQWLADELLTTSAVSGLWVETRHTNIDKYIDRYFRVILRPIWHLCSYNQQKKILTLPNGKYIDFGSAERPETLEGFQYDRIVLNESGIILKKKGLWDNTVQPMSKGANTKVRFIGTPKGKNQLHKFYIRGQSGRDDWKSYQFTAYQSPFWSKEELDAIKPQMPELVWRQEYLADFVENEGTVFRNIGKASQDRPIKKADIMAVDLAKTHDFTVITIGDSQAKHFVQVDRFNQIDWSFQKKRIVGTWLKYGKPKLRLDGTGVGSAIVDDLRSAGIEIDDFKFTSVSKQEIIKNLAVALDNTEITFSPNEELQNELSIFEYDVSRSGTIRYNAPEGFHDDCVVTLAMAYDLTRNNDDFYFSVA